MKRFFYFWELKFHHERKEKYRRLHICRKSFFGASYLCACAVTICSSCVCLFEGECCFLCRMYMCWFAMCFRVWSRTHANIHRDTSMALRAFVTKKWHRRRQGANTSQNKISCFTSSHPFHVIQFPNKFVRKWKKEWNFVLPQIPLNLFADERARVLSMRTRITFHTFMLFFLLPFLAIFLFSFVHFSYLYFATSLFCIRLFSLVCVWHCEFYGENHLLNIEHSLRSHSHSVLC